jgi:hypothetical protein
MDSSISPKDEMWFLCVCVLSNFKRSLPRLMADITAHSWRIRCGWLFTLNYQNCCSVVSFCSRKIRTLIHTVMCKIWRNIGAGKCWHILHTLQILPPCDYCLFAHKKEYLWGKLLELEDYVTTAVNASLHCLSKHYNRAIMHCLLCRCESCVDSACDYTV